MISWASTIPVARFEDGGGEPGGEPDLIGDPALAPAQARR
jgi:hypothetical protein